MRLRTGRHWKLSAWQERFWGARAMTPELLERLEDRAVPMGEVFLFFWLEDCVVVVVVDYYYILLLWQY
jgi:hypothetical protein